jgi:hypothetical protein
MLKQASVLGLCGATLVGMMALPAQADDIAIEPTGDTATVQTTTSEFYIEGIGNKGMQSTTQINHTQRGRGSSTATVQDAYTGATILGKENTVYQEQTQINMTKAGNSRRPPRVRGYQGPNNAINVQQQ